MCQPQHLRLKTKKYYLLMNRLLLSWWNFWLICTWTSKLFYFYRIIIFLFVISKLTSTKNLTCFRYVPWTTIQYIITTIKAISEISVVRIISRIQGIASRLRIPQFTMDEISTKIQDNHLYKALMKVNTRHKFDGYVSKHFKVRRNVIWSYHNFIIASEKHTNSIVWCQLLQHKFYNNY